MPTLFYITVILLVIALMPRIISNWKYKIEIPEIVYYTLASDAVFRFQHLGSGTYEIEGNFDQYQLMVTIYIERIKIGEGSTAPDVPYPQPEYELQSRVCSFYLQDGSPERYSNNFDAEKLNRIIKDSHGNVDPYSSIVLPPNLSIAL